MSYAWGANIWDHENPVTLSYSSSGVWEYCKRKFEFYKFYPATTREESFDGEVGHAMHKAFQHWLIKGCTPDAMEEAYYILLLEYPILMQSDPEGKKSLETCYATLVNIFNNGGALLEYEVATVICLDGIERPAIEVEFEIWIDGLYVDGRPFVFRGFIDAILFNRFTGEYIVVDLKTTGWKGQNLVGVYKFSGQGLPYGIVLQAVLNRDVNNFEVMYVHAELDIVDPLTKIIQFTKTTADVTDWATTLLMQISTIRECWDRNYFPRTEHGCVNRFGKVCDYMSVCDQRDRELIMRYMTANMSIEEQPKPRAPWVRIVLPLGEAA